MKENTLRNLFKYNISLFFITYALLLFFILISALCWFSYMSYKSQVKLKRSEMEYFLSSAELQFINNTAYVESLLNHIGRRIQNSNHTEKEIAQILNSFSKKYGGEINKIISISMFSFVQKNYLTINSEKGILENPVNLSSRDYLQKTKTEPWILKIGSPVIGGVSKEWIIPAGLGVQDKDGRYLGTIVMGFKIEDLRRKFLLINKDINFILLDNNNKIVIESSKNLYQKQKFLIDNIKTSDIDKHFSRVLTDVSLFNSDIKYYSIYKSIKNYPYVMLVSYDEDLLLSAIKKYSLKYLVLSLLILVAFLAIFLGIKNMIVNPIIKLSVFTKAISENKDTELSLPKSKIKEIENLIKEIEKIRDYKTQILNANKEQRAFFANMSHELRTPVNAILAFAKMMRSEIYGPVNPEMAEALDDIITSSTHLTSLLTSLLDISKINAGKMELSETEFNLTEESKSIIHSTEALAKEKNIKINFSASNKVGNIFADKTMYRQILLNLISNAIKFSNEESQIDFTIKLKDRLEIIVKDYGIGIKKENLAKIMSEYGQIHDGFSRNNIQGTGLGLILSRKMAFAQGGDLEIKSKFDKGTKVIFTLPITRLR